MEWPTEFQHNSYEFSINVLSVRVHRHQNVAFGSQNNSNCKGKLPKTVLTKDSDLVQFCRLLTDPNCSVVQGDCSAASLLRACIVSLPLLSCPSLSSVPVPTPQPVLQPEGNGTGGCHLVAIPDYDGAAICWQHVQMSCSLPETEEPASTLTNSYSTTGSL